MIVVVFCCFFYIQQTCQHLYWLHLVNVGTIQSLKSAKCLELNKEHGIVWSIKLFLGLHLSVQTADSRLPRGRASWEDTEDTGSDKGCIEWTWASFSQLAWK